jgi:hypothetical protein
VPKKIFKPTRCDHSCNHWATWFRVEHTVHIAYLMTTISQQSVHAVHMYRVHHPWLCSGSFAETHMHAVSCHVCWKYQTI